MAKKEAIIFRIIQKNRSDPYSWTFIGKFPEYELDHSDFQNRVMGQTVLLEKSSNSQFKNFGAWHRPVSGKIIQNKLDALLIPSWHDI